MLESVSSIVEAAPRAGARDSSPRRSLVLYRIRVKLSLAMGRKSDSRQRLMDAAHELIWGYSYGAVTIEAICERARVKKGSFYYFFDSKSDLAMSAIIAWWDKRRILVEDR